MSHEFIHIMCFSFIHKSNIGPFLQLCFISLGDLITLQGKGIKSVFYVRESAEVSLNVGYYLE